MKVRIGNGKYIDWEDGADPDEFFLRRDQLVGGNPPTAWEDVWGDGGTINDIKNPIFEMAIGTYERDRLGIWDFFHSMLTTAQFKDELLQNVTIKMNKYMAYFYLTITAPCGTNGDITVTCGLASKTITLNTTDHDTAAKVAQAIRSVS